MQSFIPVPAQPDEEYYPTRPDVDFKPYPVRQAEEDESKEHFSADSSRPSLFSAFSANEINAKAALRTLKGKRSDVDAHRHGPGRAFAIIVLFYLIGFAFAIGHASFNTSLQGQPVQTPEGQAGRFQQATAIRIGTALAWLSQTVRTPRLPHSKT